VAAAASRNSPRDFSIQKLPPADRPRERLRALGVGSLSTAELLAVVLGSGGAGRSALRLAQDVLAMAGGSLRRLERDVLVTRGILNSSLVHPREVFREAIAERAAAIILVHNHPSGDPTPSADDRAVTAQLVAAGRLLDIPVHDHIIVGRGRYASFAEAGLL